MTFVLTNVLINDFILNMYISYVHKYEYEKSDYMYV